MGFINIVKSFITGANDEANGLATGECLWISGNKNYRVDKGSVINELDDMPKTNCVALATNHATADEPVFFGDNFSYHLVNDKFVKTVIPLDTQTQRVWKCVYDSTSDMFVGILYGSGLVYGNPYREKSWVVVNNQAANSRSICANNGTIYVGRMGGKIMTYAFRGGELMISTRTPSEATNGGIDTKMGAVRSLAFSPKLGLVAGGHELFRSGKIVPGAVPMVGGVGPNLSAACVLPDGNVFMAGDDCTFRTVTADGMFKPGYFAQKGLIYAAVEFDGKIFVAGVRIGFGQKKASSILGPVGFINKSDIYMNGTPKADSDDVIDISWYTDEQKVKIMNFLEELKSEKVIVPGNTVEPAINQMGSGFSL